jgi:hypothetical protein
MAERDEVIRAFIRRLIGVLRTYDVRHTRRIPKGYGERGRAIVGCVLYDKKRIYIKGRGVGEDIDTVLHELFHAAFEELDEERVTDLAERVLGWLWDGTNEDVWEEIKKIL